MTHRAATPRRPRARRLGRLLLSVVLAVMASGCGASRSATAPAPALLDALQRGVNLSHWFTHRAAFEAVAAQSAIGPDDLRLIGQLGLGHVRIGVDPEWLMASATALDELMAGLDAARAAGLAVVLALQPQAAYKHALFADPAARKQLMQAWARVAQPLSRWPVSAVAFEALNEPEHDDPAAVRQLMTEIVATLRQIAPQHTVIVSPGGYADVDDLVAFAPLAARNLIYTFHFYEPKNFTHQGAYWGWPMWVSFSGFPYPSSPEAVAAPLQRAAPDVQPHLAHYGDERWNRARLAHALDRASEWARRHGVPIWCGEFGVYRANAAPAHRRAWLNDVTGLMQARGIGWALWDYAGPFGLTQGARPPRELDTDMAAAMGLRTVQP